MKSKIILLILVFISLCCVAQKRDYVKVYQGATADRFFLSDVDSITHNDGINAYLFGKYQMYSYPYSNIDSISFIRENVRCYQIAKCDLNGWDEGIYCMTDDNEDFYIVSRSDVTEDGERYVSICLNLVENDDPNMSIVFTLSIDGNLQNIIYGGYLFKAYLLSDNYMFEVFNNKGELVGSFNVPQEIVYIDNNAKRRSPIYNAKGKFSIPKTKDFLKKCSPYFEVLGITKKINDGKYGEILVDYAVGALVGALELPFIVEILVAEVIKEIAQYLYKQEIKRLLGDAEIEITSIKRIDESTIKVDVSLSNLSTIPLYRIEANFKKNIFEDIPNEVYWGIAEGKSGQPGLYLNRNCTGTLPVVNDKATYSFIIKRELAETFYFRPFLAPNQELQSRLATCIRYGEQKEYIDVDITLSNFKQVFSYKEDGKNIVRITFDGNVPGQCSELSGWGFIVKTKSGSFEQFLSSKDNYNDFYPPVQKTFSCDIKLEDKDIIDNGVEKLADIIIRPCYSLRNSIILFYYLDDLNYTVKIQNLTSCPDKNHPHMIDLGLPSGTKWSCCNVGATKPEEYGAYYAWGEVKEKNYYYADNYSYAKECSYSECEWYGMDPGYYKFVNIGDEISGSKYDAATANWGAPWRMPTYSEYKELLDNTTYKYYSKNGVEGHLISGPNGASLFFPATGEKTKGELLYTNTYGAYWSATASIDFPQGACCMSFSNPHDHVSINTPYEGGIFGLRFLGLPVRPIVK